MKTIQEHYNDVSKIQKQLSESQGEITLQRTNSCCSRSFEYKKKRTQIDVSCLNKIIELNVQENSIVIEPLVTMEQIVSFLSPYHLIVPVITEFRHMTIGGAIQGLGGESSSFEYGFIDESVLEYEVLLSDGTLLTVKKDDPNFQDIYSAMPGSFGSLIILTKIKLRLVPATKYVRIHYQKLTNIAEVKHAFINAKNDGVDFIECIAIAKNDFRLARGYKTNEISFSHRLKRCSLKYFWSPWYYYHLREKSEKDNAHEYLSFEDYLFRWDRGAFWIGILKLKHTIVNRLLYGRALVCKRLYKILHTRTLLQQNSQLFMQDLMVPMYAMEKFFYYLDEKLTMYPIWIIPIKSFNDNNLFSISSKIDTYYIDFGIWGSYKKQLYFFDMHRQIEQFLMQNQGKKWLWAQSYLSETEFWQVYDKNFYNHLRLKYKANDRLINIYQKVSELYRSIKADHKKAA